MKNSLRFATLLIAGFLMCFFSGCVERELTINTSPQGGIVILNDEEVGTSPVTVNFKWYGIYKVRIDKKGYATFAENVKLKRPGHDYFPRDLFEELLKPNRIDSYTWNFELKPYQEPNRKLLIDQAVLANEQMELELLDLRPI